MADSLGLRYLETSAKSSNNVDKAFFSLATEIQKDHEVSKMDDESKPKKLKVGDVKEEFK